MPLVVALTKILSAKNARRGCRAKDRQIVDKNQLVDNGNAGHLLRAQLSHHDIIQKTDQIGNGIL